MQILTAQLDRFHISAHTGSLHPDPDIEPLHLPRKILPQPHVFLGVTAILTSVIIDSVVPAFEFYYINEMLKEILFYVWLFSHSIVSLRFIQLHQKQQCALFHGMNLPLSEFHFLNSILRIYPSLHSTGIVGLWTASSLG